MSEYALVTAGRGSITGYPAGEPNCKVTGYQLSRFLDELADGGVIVDMREWVETEPNAFRIAFDMPMVRVDLPAGEVEKCPEPSDLLTGALAEDGGTFGALCVRRKVDRKFSGLDYVGVADYARLWHEQGARVGVRDGDTVRWWGDGTVEHISRIS